MWSFFGLFLLYTNFYYWKVAFAFYGNTYRGFVITLLLFLLYRWIKEDNLSYRWLVLPTLLTGFAVSSTFLAFSFAVLLAFAAYLFNQKKDKALSLMFFLIGPLVLYVSAFISRTSWFLTLALLLLYLFITYTKPIQPLLDSLSSFLNQYSKVIFFVLIPGLFILGSIIVVCLNPSDTLYSYARYFDDFQKIDMVKDYLLVYSNPLDFILNLFRWTGVLLLVRKAANREDTWMKCFVLIMVILFLNPLCTPLLAKTVTGIVYYRNFETLFNPFTECLFFLYVYRSLEDKKVFASLFLASLVCILLVGQIGSYAKFDWGLYAYYVDRGVEVNPIYKTDSDEQLAIDFLSDYLQQNGTTESLHPLDRDPDFANFTAQPVVISQSNALRAAIPNAYQLFGAREHFYPYDRVDWNFYEIARPHFDWLSTEDAPYQDTCMYLERYDVDYLVIQYWDNHAFDLASDACSLTIYNGSKYKVKIVEKN